VECEKVESEIKSMKDGKGQKMKKSFEDLNVWRVSCQLAIEIYRNFGNLKDWGFRDQLCRAAVSIPSNVAEGFERGSTQEFIRFLYIAKGSAGELRTQLFLSMELGYSAKEVGLNLIEQCRQLSGMLQNLITSLKAKKRK
jgi:four helix bundle protein